MSGDRLFLDTAFIQAQLNPRDSYHERAKQLLPRIRAATEVWITEAVLVEVGNAFSVSKRDMASRFINTCYRTANINVVTVTPKLLQHALKLYQSRPDKSWGLTDCISFVVMEMNGLTDAATSDRHFTQAGFRALMLEPD